jgi:3D (Asp-Asp-Asp) domain-containing protein
MKIVENKCWPLAKIGVDMGDKICDSSDLRFKNRVSEKLREVKWELEKLEHFVGFNYSAEVLYSSGITHGGRRAGIVDSRVMYKHATGSRHIIKFTSVKEAVDFWNENVRLETYPVKGDLIPRGSKVKVIRDSHNTYGANGRLKGSREVVGYVGIVSGSTQTHVNVKCDVEWKYQYKEYVGDKLVTRESIAKTDYIMISAEDLEVIEMAPPSPPIIPRGSRVRIKGDSMNRYGSNMDLDMNKSILGLEGIVSGNFGLIGFPGQKVNMENNVDLLFKGLPCPTWPTGWSPVVEVYLMQEDLEVIQVGVY